MDWETPASEGPVGSGSRGIGKLRLKFRFSRPAASQGPQSNDRFDVDPDDLVMGEWDPDAVRAHIRDFLDRTRGCVVEMILKDTHTCRHQPRRMWEWVKIAKEETTRFADSAAG